MTEARWGPEGPPQEAYSRVTNPERFAPLHDFALDLLQQLEADFDVERIEGYDLDPELETRRLARPSVKLLPLAHDAAQLLITFTVFPAVIARAGRWYTEPIPHCGCDACDETAASATSRLAWLVENVVAGRFREAIKLPRLMGDAWQSTEIGLSGSGRRESGRSRVDRARARNLLAGCDRSSYEWQPWWAAPEPLTGTREEMVSLIARP